MMLTCLFKDYRLLCKIPDSSNCCSFCAVFLGKINIMNMDSSKTAQRSVIQFLTAESIPLRKILGSSIYPWMKSNCSAERLTEAMLRLPARWEKCIAAKGAYFEKWLFQGRFLIEMNVQFISRLGVYTWLLGWLNKMTIIADGNKMVLKIA